MGWVAWRRASSLAATSRGRAHAGFGWKLVDPQQLAKERAERVKGVGPKRVVDPLGVAPGGDQAGSPQGGEVVRDQVLRPAELLFELADATLALGEEDDQCQSTGSPRARRRSAAAATASEGSQPSRVAFGEGTVRINVCRYCLADVCRATE